MQSSDEFVISAKIKTRMNKGNQFFQLRGVEISIKVIKIANDYRAVYRFNGLFQKSAAAFHRELGTSGNSACIQKSKKSAAPCVGSASVLAEQIVPKLFSYCVRLAAFRKNKN